MKNIKIVQNYNLNITEIRDSNFKNAFPGIFNFTVGILLITRSPPWIWVARKVPINGKYGFGMSVMGLLMKILNDRILRKGDTAISIITR